jgi:hypothetical protein
MSTDFPTSQRCLGHKSSPWAATSDSHAGRHARRAESGSLYQFYALQLSERNAELGFQRATRELGYRQRKHEQHSMDGFLSALNSGVSAQEIT